MTVITSLQNPRVKDAVRLRARPHREKQGRILIDGIRELGRAIEAGVPIIEVFVCGPLGDDEEAARLAATLPHCGAEILQVSPPVLEKLAYGRRAEGVLGVAQMPRPGLDDLRLPDNPLVAVLERVEKPGNLGAVLRSADGAGVSAVVAADSRTDLYNPNAIRASLGTVFTMPVCEAASRETLDFLLRHGLKVYAARPDGSLPYTAADFRRPSTIVLGSESDGLSPLWADAGVTAVRLPMLGSADSLNVSAAAAVLFYEARRQRDSG